MHREEFFCHLLLGVSHSFLWGCSVEADEVVVESAVEALDLIKDEAEHSKGVKFLIDLVQLLSNRNHSMLHSEESISHDCLRKEEF